MKKDNQIQEMLDRFMAGTSTLEEEARLGEYFRQHKVKAEWRVYQRMFAYFDSGMDERLLAAKGVQPRRHAKQIVWTLLAAAAAVAAFLIIRTNIPQQADNIQQDVRTASVIKSNTQQNKVDDTESLKTQTTEQNVRNISATKDQQSIEKNYKAQRATDIHREVAVISIADSLSVDSVMRDATEDMELNYKILLAAQLRQQRTIRTVDEQLINSNLVLFAANADQQAKEEAVKQYSRQLLEDHQVVNGKVWASANSNKPVFMGFQ